MPKSWWSKKLKAEQLSNVQKSLADKAKMIEKEEPKPFLPASTWDKFFQDMVQKHAEQMLAAYSAPWPQFAKGPLGVVQAPPGTGKSVLHMAGQSYVFMDSGMKFDPPPEPVSYNQLMAEWLSEVAPLPAVPAEESGYSRSGSLLKDAVPGLRANITVQCPACSYVTRGCPCGCTEAIPQLIIHLNDHHGWPRAASEAEPGQPNIADWLEEWALREGVDLTFKVPEEIESKEIPS